MGRDALPSTPIICIIIIVLPFKWEWPAYMAASSEHEHTRTRTQPHTHTRVGTRMAAAFCLGKQKMRSVCPRFRRQN